MKIEKWTSAFGYESLYMVSDKGRVKSLKTGKLLKPHDNGHGYLRVSLTKNGKSKLTCVHRIVMTSFLGNSDMQVNHKNGIRNDNRLCNLEYCTGSQNILHAVKRGTIKPATSETCNFRKLTTAQVLEIKKILKEKNYKNYEEIANKYGVYKTTIGLIKRGLTWRNV